jgi:WD40 repeat protein
VLIFFFLFLVALDSHTVSLLTSSNTFLYIQSNPVARWHICQGSINSIAFSTDGSYLATVGRDGIIYSFFYHLHILVLFVYFVHK